MLNWTVIRKRPSSVAAIPLRLNPPRYRMGVPPNSSHGSISPMPPCASGTRKSVGRNESVKYAASSVTTTSLMRVEEAGGVSRTSIRSPEPAS